MREICATVHELSRRVTLASASVETAAKDAPRGPVAALCSDLFSVGESVERLRWLSMALVSAQLELVESTVDLAVVLKECLEKVRPALPEQCECVCVVQPGVIVQGDLTLLVEAFALLLNAASLRLGGVHAGPAPRAKLTLRARAHSGKAVIRLAYNAPYVERDEANGHEQLALKVFRSFGGSASVRTTKRWCVIHLRLPQEVASSKQGETV